ncbi:hypothetical protein ACWDY4_26135 [Streptomyces olivaceoviridis]
MTVLPSSLAGRAERDDVARDRLVVAAGAPEEDGCREGHLLRSMPRGGLGSSGVLESFLQADNLSNANQYFTCADMTKLDKALPDRPTESADSVEARAADLFATFRGRAPR